MPNAVPGVATFVFAQDPACEVNGEAEVMKINERRWPVEYR